MLSCPLCQAKCSTVNALKVHLNSVHPREWRIPYRCGEQGCHGRSYDRIANWVRHIKNEHGNLIETGLPVIQEETAAEDTDTDTDTVDCSANDIDDDHELLEQQPSLIDLRNEIETSAAHFVAGLRAHSSVTINTCELAVNTCNDVTESIVNYLKCAVSNYLSANEIEVDMKALHELFDEQRRPLEFLSTERKQNAYFTKQTNFVQPETKNFGAPRYEPRSVPGGEPKQKAVYDTWQYVSIGRTLQAVFSFPELLNELKGHNASSVISEFKDGKLSAEHDLLRDKAKYVAALQLYYDDLEVANPLGSNAGLHKQGVFYFTIRNLPPYFTSSMANIHLVALGKQVDWKNYGYAQTLGILADEIRNLGLNGIDIVLPGQQNVTVYACLAAVNGDNLGRHTILGLVESFRATHFCAQCMVSNKEIQTVFQEKQFEMRTKDKYEEQLAAVLQAKQGTQAEFDRKQKVSGIKTSCPLNNVTGWHVTKNRVGDLMHDFLEGVGPYEVKLALYHLIYIQKLFTLDQLKERIGLFAYGITDVRNRPREILELRNVASPNFDKSMKQSALDFWCLFRLLPLMIGDYVPPGNAYWDFYLELREIADILFSQTWTRATASYYRTLYAEHLTSFKNLFPEHSLIPKHHFLIHYATYAETTGPPYMSMVAAEEMKGNYFKRTAHLMCNFMNVPFSLAKKHQYFAYANLLSGKILKNRLEVTKGKTIHSESLPEATSILRALELNEHTRISVLKRFSFRGQEYRCEQVLCVLRNEQGTPQFGRLECAISKNYSPESLNFLVQMYTTLGFERHLYARVHTDPGNP